MGLAVQAYARPRTELVQLSADYDATRQRVNRHHRRSAVTDYSPFSRWRAAEFGACRNPVELLLPLIM